MKEKTHFLRVHRVACGLKIKELAKEMYVSKSLIQKIEGKLLVLKIGLVNNLCSYFAERSPKTIEKLKPEDFLF